MKFKYIIASFLTAYAFTSQAQAYPISSNSEVFENVTLTVENDCFMRIVDKSYTKIYNLKKVDYIYTVNESKDIYVLFHNRESSISFNSLEGKVKFLTKLNEVIVKCNY